MKSFSERNPIIVGAVGTAILVAIVTAALNYTKLPLVNPGRTYSAYFAEVGGLGETAHVRVSGYPVGKVSAIELDEHGARVTFRIPKGIRLGDRTEAMIKTESFLGSKFLEISPRGDGQLVGPIPMDRTVSPYQLAATVGELASTISGLDTDQLSNSLATLAETFSDTPTDLKDAVQGIGRLSQTLNERDDQLRRLLDNAAKSTGVLAKRTNEIVGLVTDTNALLAQLRTQSQALDQLWTNLSALSVQLKGFIAENRTQLRPTLDKLNHVLAIVDGRREQVQKALKGFRAYSTSLGEAVSSGPFFKAYLSNLLPGQFVQPYVESAFSDLGLDPATLLPSELTDPPTGQPGTPALPGPYPRTGQGGAPRVNLPDAITGNPGDQPCGWGTGCYPYRPEPPSPAPGGPPPGPPAPAAAPGLQSTPEPTPKPIYVPVPGEVGQRG